MDAGAHGMRPREDKGRWKGFMKILYFDCFSGVSGDMTLAALLDLGLPLEKLQEELKKLGLENYSLKFVRGPGVELPP
jgi:hypothetical protein